MNKLLFSFSLVLLLAAVSMVVRRPEPLPDPVPVRAAFAAAHGDTLPGVIQEEILSPSSIGEVVFPHLAHVDDFGLECVECHHETNAAALRTPHDDYFEDFWIECAACHRGNGDASLEAQTCSNCHPSHPRDIADETLSAKVAIHTNCWECHDIGTGAEASENCVFCHSGPRTPPNDPLPDTVQMP